jgi:Icc-related predicted phosphoesterase
MTEVVFAGDWHGNLPWATSRIQSIAASGVTTILHVGDFGIWPGASGKRYLQAVENTCARNGVEILVTPGNHEDWARLTALWANAKHRDPDTGAALPVFLTEHVQVLPRGHRFEIDGTRFMSFGGAASVDRHLRTEGVDWWPEEMPTEGDVQAAIAGEPVGVLITHDSPEAEWCVPAVRATLAHNPHGWPQDSLSWAAVSRSRVNRVFEAIRPRLLVHGHHHVWGERVVQLPHADHVTKVVSLASDGEIGNVWRLDLNTTDHANDP